MTTSIHEHRIQRNLPDGWLAIAKRAFSQGAITWESIPYIQRTAMPRCPIHDLPTEGIRNNVPFCDACIDEFEALCMAVHHYEAIHDTE